MLVTVVSALCTGGCRLLTTQYVQNSSTLSMNVDQFMVANNRPPESRRELSRFELQRGLEPVSTWFTSLQFSINELGHLIIHSRKGWFLWQQGNGTMTLPMKGIANNTSEVIRQPADGLPKPSRRRWADNN